MFIFDVIGLGEPSLAGRNWSSGEDWAVLVETTENQAERTLLRDIQTFRRVGEAYRRGHEIHRVRLFDVQTLCDHLASYGFLTQTAQAYGSLRLPLAATPSLPQGPWPPNDAKAAPEAGTL
ncbi:MAG TPA: hypothetical protein VMO17_23725 [Terriglobia bacterium]|nr:hypothetical protein [Terriglobia bacterium]